MPFNITQGSTVEFTVGFLDASGNQTVPSSATLTMTYSTGVATTLVSSVIGMSPSGQLFTATWGSGQSWFGVASYSISAPGQATPTVGTLRLLDP